MTAEARQSPEQPLPANLAMWEEAYSWHKSLLPVDHSRVNFIIGRGGAAAAVFDGANGVIRPLVEDPLVSKPTRLYDLDRLLILREISNIRGANRGRRDAARSDEQVIEELKRRLAGTRLEPLLSWQEPQTLDDIPFAEFLETTVFRNLGVGKDELSQIEKRIKTWPRSPRLQRRQLIEKVPINAKLFNDIHLRKLIFDALVFLVGAKQDNPVSYAMSTVGDLQDITSWCIEAMDESGCNLADIIDRFREQQKNQLTSFQQ